MSTVPANIARKFADYYNKIKLEFIFQTHKLSILTCKGNAYELV
jgi:hypothetical protein